MARMSFSAKDRPRVRPLCLWVAFACVIGSVSAAVAERAKPLGKAATLPEHSAREVMSPSEQVAFTAVGRVKNSDGGRHCTGTLIAPDLVLTAAHCVANAETGWVAPPYRVIFEAGYRQHRASAIRVGRRLVLADGYLGDGEISADLALIQLKDPIADDLVRPLPVAPTSMLRAHPLSVYSYGYDVPQVLSEEKQCRSLAKLADAMVTNCEAVGGVSGAPVVARDEEGAKHVTAVVSSRLARSDRNAAYGRAVVVPVDAARLEALISRLTPAP